MTCDRCEELLSTYLEGELRPEEKSEVDAHVEACPGCRRLLAALTATQEALGRFPEVEVSEGLRSRLLTIPEKRKKFSFTFDFLLKPSLQPVFAAATVFLTLLSFYLFNPNKKTIDRSIDQKIHYGYSQVEKLYAKAGSITDRLDSYKENFLGTVKSWKILGGSQDQTQK
jgi:hypothetical protein